MTKKNKMVPSAEIILSEVEIPEELCDVPEFEDVWNEWVHYKQEECSDFRGIMKPWKSVDAAQRWLTQINNKHMQGRDVVHVIRFSMLNEWVGIRFDLVDDSAVYRLADVMKPKSRDQLSGLDQEWLRVNDAGNNSRKLN